MMVNLKLEVGGAKEVIQLMKQEGENLTKEQIEEEIQKIKKAHADDKDEVDTPLDVPARKRFAKYRGLKSFRTSSWDPKESLPLDYARIFAFDNFARTQKLVLAKALDMELGNRDDCVSASSYARLYNKDVPVGIVSKLCELAKTIPVRVSGLLQDESKMPVLHFRPIFSADNINYDKHKMERFLHAGHFSLASIYAPILFPPLPLIVLKGVDGDDAPSVAAVGALRSIDADKIILKKIILTAYELCWACH